MDEYLLGGALLLLLVLLLLLRVVRARQRRAQHDEPAAESSLVTPSRFRSWRTASRHDSTQAPGLPPGDGADAQRAEREAAEEAARIAGDREAAEWEARLVAEQLARQAEQEAELAAKLEIDTRTPLQLAAEAQAAAERSEREALESLERSYAEAERLAAERLTEAVDSVPAELPPEPTPEPTPETIPELPSEELGWEWPEPPPPPPAAPAPPPPAPPSGGIVLIADVSKVVRLKTSRLLEQHGWQVLLATDGLRALEHIATSVPHALITGAELPGLDGLELTRHLRAAAVTAHLPIVMISANDEALRESARDAGVSLLLGKPYAEGELIDYLASTRSGA